MPTTNFSLNKVQLWAVINGLEVELVQVELHYYLNAIPSATLLCAIGREIRSLLPATIHGTVDQMQTLAPVVVWALGSEENHSGFSGGTWPIDPFIVFTGQVVGTAFRKSRDGNALLSIQCRHFLVGLEYSWTMTKSTHPMNVGNLHKKIAPKLVQNNPNFLTSTLASRYFTRTNIETDYWSNALQPMLFDICAQTQVFDNEALETGNGDAIATLDSFEPLPSEGYNYRFGVPLQINSFAVLGQRPGINALASDAAIEMFRCFQSATIWEKLISDFGSRYLFSIVPMANRALLAPVIPGLRSVWATIDASEYESINLTGMMAHPIRGVVLWTGNNSVTGAFGLQRGNGQAIQRIGGHYENPDMEEGRIHFRDLPQWLGNAVSPIVYGPAAAPNALKGNAFRGPLGIAPPIPVPAALRALAQTLWDEYAKAIYVSTVFQQRRGSVTGKVRFDIAPGSTIELIAVEEKFVAASGLVASDQPLYGLVTGVTTTLNSDSATGYTAFEISHIRNEADQDDPNLTLDAHPLWAVPFLGAPLVEEITSVDLPPEIPI